jgi:hypothetical protein
VGRYWVDANVFIWGSNVPYKFVRAQGYWNWFSRKIYEGVIVTHVTVYEEVIKGNKSGKEEPIIPWMIKHKDCGLRIKSTKDSQIRVGEICTRAFEIYDHIKARDFVKGADPFLIAHASLERGTVVTQENRRKELRIPQLCGNFGVAYMNMYEMNEALQAEYGS